MKGIVGPPWPGRLVSCARPLLAPGHWVGSLLECRVPCRWERGVLGALGHTFEQQGVRTEKAVPSRSATGGQRFCFLEAGLVASLTGLSGHFKMLSDHYQSMSLKH